MQVTLLADRSIFESALAESSKAGTAVQLHGLHAPADAAFLGYLEEAWDSVKSLLETAFDAAVGKVEELRQAALATIDKALADAGQRAADVAVALRERLRLYIATLIEGMLKTLCTTIELAGVTLKVAEVDVSQKVILGGSLKAALTEAVALTSSGEFTIQAKYRSS